MDAVAFRTSEPCDADEPGITLKPLIKHEKNGDEVQLFFRRTKTEHPEGGFRYEGQFKYVGHTGSAHFHFKKVST